MFRKIGCSHELNETVFLFYLCPQIFDIDGITVVDSILTEILTTKFEGLSMRLMRLHLPSLRGLAQPKK